MISQGFRSKNGLELRAKAAKLARVAAAPSQTEGLPWDTPGFESPREFGTPVAAARAADDTEIVAESTGTPTSLYMIGSVAVGVVMVSRDTGTEVLTDAERIKIVQEVQEGLDWLAGVEPRASVSFVYDIRPVTVSSAPGPYAGVTEPYERFERDWRDAALATMGYAAGRPGYQQYANDLRSSRHTDWAYVAFFTKYPLNHFAYAVVEKVVMNYANDGWGPDNINRVFAHESCHIFGAADEYGSCVCGSTSGQLGVPNNNCVNCFPPGAQVPCLMNANTLEMCDFSRRQIGWDVSLFPSPLAIFRHMAAFDNGGGEVLWVVKSHNGQDWLGWLGMNNNAFHPGMPLEGVRGMAAFDNGGGEVLWVVKSHNGQDWLGWLGMNNNAFHPGMPLEGVRGMAAFDNGGGEVLWVVKSHNGQDWLGWLGMNNNAFHPGMPLEGVRGMAAFDNGGGEVLWVVKSHNGQDWLGWLGMNNSAFHPGMPLEGVRDMAAFDNGGGKVLWVVKSHNGQVWLGWLGLNNNAFHPHMQWL